MDEYIRSARGAPNLNKVHVFFDDDTNTLSYVLSDMDTQDAVVIDPLLNFDPAGVQTSTTGIDAILEYVKYNNLKVRMILETHPHADPLSGAQALKSTDSFKKPSILARISLSMGASLIGSCIMAKRYRQGR